MGTESTNTSANEQKIKANSQQKGKPRVVSHPGDVAGLVMMQIDAVNGKKDELTIVIKNLADTTKQLVRVYAQQAAAIQKLQKRVQELEEKAKDK